MQVCVCLILFAKTAASFALEMAVLPLRSDAAVSCGHVSFSSPPQNSYASSF